MKYTKDTTLEEVLKNKKAKEVLEKHEVPCLGCPMAKFEASKLTLEEICKGYKLDLEEILEELNNIGD